MDGRETAHRLVDNPDQIDDVIRPMSSSEKDKLIKYLVWLVVYFKSQTD